MHEQLHIDRTSWEIESFDVHGIDSFETLKCLGCGEVKIRHTKWISDEDPLVVYFPPAVFRPEPAWVQDLGQEIPLGEDGTRLRIEDGGVVLSQDGVPVEILMDENGVAIEPVPFPPPGSPP